MAPTSDIRNPAPSFGPYQPAAREADGARQHQRAVFEGIFQTGIDEKRRCAAFELRLEIFFGNPRNAHAPYCRRRLTRVSTAGAGSVLWHPPGSGSGTDRLLKNAA